MSRPFLVQGSLSLRSHVGTYVPKWLRQLSHLRSLHARWGPEAAPPGNLRITSVVHLSPNLVTLSADNFKAGDELVAIIGIVAVTEAPVLRDEIPPDAFAFARKEAKFWPLNVDMIDNWLASAHLERPASAHTA